MKFFVSIKGLVAVWKSVGLFYFYKITKLNTPASLLNKDKNNYVYNCKKFIFLHIYTQNYLFVNFLFLMLKFEIRLDQKKETEILI